MRLCFFSLVPLLALAGCGGGGDDAKPATDATRALVARTVVDAQSALGHSSLEASFLPLFSVDAGSRPLLPPSVGDVAGGVPEGTVPDFYYSEGVSAWIQTTRTEESYREDYYLDEAKTQKAGFYEDGNAGERYEFTAGPYAGARGEGTYTIQDLPGEDGDISHERYRKVAPDGTVFEGEVDWTGLEQTFRGTTTHPDGTRDTFDGRDVYPHDGRLTFRSGKGPILTVTFPESNGVSKGLIRGTANGLGASFTIDADNAMTIRYADGTTQTFEGASDRGKGLGRAARARTSGRR